MLLEAPPSPVSAIVVEAPRLPSLAGQEAFSTATYDARALSGQTRLDDVLKTTPGVSLFRRTGSDAANPTIQGLSLRAVAPSGAGRALVTLDGAPQNDPFGGWVIWTALPGEGLSGATIVRGAGAGPYGAGALTGVVVLRERAVGGGLSSFTAQAGQRDSWRAAGTFGTDHLLLTASGSRTDGYRPVRGAAVGAADAPTTLEDGSIAARVQGELGDVRWAVRAGAFQEKRGAGLVGARSNATGGSLAVTLAGEAWRLQAWARSSDLENTSAAVAAGRVGTTPANDQYSTPASGYGLNAAWQHKAGDWSWELGGDVRATEGRTNELFRYMAGAFTRQRTAGGRTLVGGLYAETAYAREDFSLTAGARLDGWRSYAGVRRERDAATGALTLDAPPADASGTTPTARIGVRQRVSGETWWRAAAYAGFRPPTLNELHRPFRVGNDVTEANAALKPETLYGLETGLAGEGAVRWTLGAFYNQVQDPITNVTIGVGPGTFPIAGFIPAGGVLRQRRNAGEISAYGLEGDMAADLSPAWTVRAAFSATHARVDGAAQLTGKRPAQAPALTVTAGARWRPIERLSLDADLRYESKRFEDDLNTRTLKAGAGLDLRVGWKVSPTSEIYLAADNALDADLAVGQTADGVTSYSAPRTIYVGFALRR
ncbi:MULTISPECIES: TonB-dependent receptor [unclassified Caulobacter]|uniref:TonB-dependent receptor n=1 Tax=unclassified Caulobacter TaxID=2648921 RepID=UPI0006FBA8F9|nr:MULTISPECIES: TonB-dependent receptor plug domain-containing protein [unclassified Caulobacter]KQV58573.1 TonB-dependent receptor [Caulobacter sp. Root342]KQV68918.1 TonB-dependent receptor [Caulobacter sp. Root343]